VGIIPGFGIKGLRRVPSWIGGKIRWISSEMASSTFGGVIPSVLRTQVLRGWSRRWYQQDTNPSFITLSGIYFPPCEIHISLMQYPYAKIPSAERRPVSQLVIPERDLSEEVKRGVAWHHVQIWVIQDNGLKPPLGLVRCGFELRWLFFGSRSAAGVSRLVNASLFRMIQYSLGRRLDGKRHAKIGGRRRVIELVGCFV